MQFGAARAPRPGGGAEGARGGLRAEGRARAGARGRGGAGARAGARKRARKIVIVPWTQKKVRVKVKSKESIVRNTE